jgi:hypothetical protein
MLTTHRVAFKIKRGQVSFSKMPPLSRNAVTTYIDRIPNHHGTVANKIVLNFNLFNNF